MELTPAGGLTLDINKLFRKSLRGMPKEMKLSGNPMQVAVAEKLLKKHEHIELGRGEEVKLMSLEQYASAIMQQITEGNESLSGRFLLNNIPEEMLIAYAERNGIPAVKEEKSDVRKMLERIAKEQPQTFFSLARSLERLNTILE